jgi:hypothetical protein
MKARWLVGVVAVSLLAGAGAAGSRASWPGYNGRIAFYGYGNAGIETVNSDGSDLAQFGTFSYSIGPPTGWIWSAQGLLAYSLPKGEGHDDRDIYLYNGTVAFRLPDWAATDLGSQSSPAWSPDGESMMFVCTRDTRTPGSTVPNGICRVPPRSSTVKLVVPGTFDALAWSPDGNQIAYDDGTHVFVAHADGTHAETLDGGPLSELEWSPDSRMLVGKGPADRIWVVDTGSGSRTLITTDGRTPAWSPDGAHVVYSAGDGSLTIAGADGSSGHVLEDAAGKAITGLWPRWLTGVRPNPPVVASRPAISGTAKEGSMLTAQPGTWNGDPPIAYAYQWQRCDTDGVNCAAIAGATSATYTPAHADAGSRLRVDVTATNAAGSASSGSDATAVVVALHTAPRIAHAHARWAKGQVRVAITVCTQDADAVRLTVAGTRRTHAWTLPATAGCRRTARHWKWTHPESRRLVVRVTDDRGAAGAPVSMRLR